MDDKNEHLDIGEGVLIEKVDKFCYLGDMLKADGGQQESDVLGKSSESIYLSL